MAQEISNIQEQKLVQEQKHAHRTAGDADAYA